MISLIKMLGTFQNRCCEEFWELDGEASVTISLAEGLELTARVAHGSKEV